MLGRWWNTGVWSHATPTDSRRRVGPTAENRRRDGARKSDGIDSPEMFGTKYFPA